MEQKKESQKNVFPVEKAGKKELRDELKNTRDPAKTIREFQRSHSLHTMMANAFETVPASKFKNTRNAGVKESLDSDCVMTFLSHLGIQQYDVHKKISEALLKQLQEAVRSKNVASSDASKQQLLELLKSCWGYATATEIPELRDVLITVLKQLGPQIPTMVLLQLGSHPDIFNQLSDSLKHLCWEADLDQKAPVHAQDYRNKLESTLFYDVVMPHIREYVSKIREPIPFVATASDRRIGTIERRRVAITDLRNVVGNSAKLLFAVVALADPHPTLLADLFVSLKLPAPYSSVVALARSLDEMVQAGNISDKMLLSMQVALRQIMPSAAVATPVSRAYNIRQVLQRVIPTAGLSAMKATDPQKLFWNPVTDEIAPGYSKYIKEPICLSDMYDKHYAHLNEWKSDVLLMFQNCVQYNKGAAGKWFRGEANRQKTVFEKEIFPQVRRLVEEKKEKEEKRTTEVFAPTIAPLVAGPMKRKKSHDPEIPDMAHLASRLLSDPFVVRIIVDRILRDLRVGVLSGSVIPNAHAIVPSLVQLLHFGMSDGAMPSLDDMDSVAWTCLRKNTPLLVRLLVEAEIDQRTATGGDWHPVRDKAHVPPALALENMDVVSTLLFQGALVFLCRQRNDISATFPKFAATIQDNCGKPFFTALRLAILRHKTKITKSSRDVILNTWLEQWFPSGLDAHEGFMALLNDWATLGNAVVPRDAHVEFSLRAIEASTTAGITSDFIQSWHEKDEKSTFAPVKAQYERMLDKILPPDTAAQWRKDAGIENKDDGDVTMEETDRGIDKEPVSPVLMEE